MSRDDCQILLPKPRTRGGIRGKLWLLQIAKVVTVTNVTKHSLAGSTLPIYLLLFCEHYIKQYIKT